MIDTHLPLVPIFGVVRPEWRLESAAMACARNQKLRRQLWEDLLINLVRDQVPLRLNRTRTPRRQTSAQTLPVAQ